MPTKSASQTTATQKPTTSTKKAAEKSGTPPTKVASRKSAKEIPKVADTGTVANPENASDLVDEQLAKYRSMRDFGVTEEPSGAGEEASQQAAARTSPARARTAGGLPFVIQKHAASHLHYDFRLGWNGVLKSWAVAKGPSFYPGDRRLAVQVEDHPMEYGGFEGVIPKGQYGGGTVMVWDQGTWWPQLGHENVDAGLREGSLKFEMHGTKLHGKWTLVRMHTTKASPDDRWKSSNKPQWLLIKEHDEFERGKDAPCITEEAPNSATTGRPMEEIAHQEDHVWNSKETAGAGQAWYRQEPAAAHSTSSPAQPQPEAAPSPTPERLTIAPRRSLKTTSSPSPKPFPQSTAIADKLEDLATEAQPEFIQPQLAQETEAPPEGKGWLHELKLDGYRMQARKSARGVQMLTRSGLDWTYRVPAVAEAIAQLPIGTVTLDGEVVVVSETGTTNFAELQASFQEGAKHPLTFFCFDLLHIEGRNPRNLPLIQRKSLLAEVLPQAQTGIVRLSEHLEANGGAMFQQACQLHAEGIVSKRADAVYRPGRSGDWLKAKCLHEQEFVIGGFTPSSDGPDRIGSLLLGYYETLEDPANHPRKLIYAGRTGTGFTQKTRRELRSQLAALETISAPFAKVTAEARRDAVWVRPELVAQVRFATWTADLHVRQAAFLGLREDKRPEEVFRETATAPPQPKGSSHARSAPDPGTPNPGAPSLPTASPSVRVGSLPALPIRLTHANKVLDPESGLTKQQLAEYYWAVAERMLPHIANRPLSLVRCPDGAGKPCFYQKHVNHMLPPGVGSVMVTDKKSTVPEPYITLSTPEALAGLAQMGVLEVHPWGSHNDALEYPDRLIFDLDPDESLPWNTVTAAAREVRDRLKKLGLESFVKTTGGKGLHIVAPILPEHTFADLKEAAHRFVLAMERAQPLLYLSKMTKAARKGKIYLDYLRNERGATAVAPFSPRARPGVTVSVTLEWKELDAPERPRFSVADFHSWQTRLGRDPWRKMFTLQQSLDLTRIQSQR